MMTSGKQVKIENIACTNLVNTRVRAFILVFFKNVKDWRIIENPPKDTRPQQIITAAGLIKRESI